MRNGQATQLRAPLARKFDCPRLCLSDGASPPARSCFFNDFRGEFRTSGSASLRMRTRRYNTLGGCGRAAWKKRRPLLEATPTLLREFRIVGRRDPLACSAEGGTKLKSRGGMGWISLPRAVAPQKRTSSRRNLRELDLIFATTSLPSLSKRD